VKHCIHIFGQTKDGDTFRPATPSPDKHWSYILLDQYAEYGSISMRWDPTPTVTIFPTFWEDCEYGFEHVMSFVRLHNLDYTIDESKCIKCDGHDSCISKENV